MGHSFSGRHFYDDSLVNKGTASVYIHIRVIMILQNNWRRMYIRLSNLFSNLFSMHLYRYVLPCVNTYLEINTV